MIKARSWDLLSLAQKVGSLLPVEIGTLVEWESAGRLPANALIKEVRSEMTVQEGSMIELPHIYNQPNFFAGATGRST